MITSNKKLSSYIEKNYDKIFDIIPEGIAIFDNKGFLLEVNNRLYAWLGYTKKEIIGKHITLLPFISTKQLPTLLKNFRNRIKGIDIPPYETILIAKNKKIKYCSIRAVPLKDDDDKIFADMVLITDISNEKTAKDALFENEEKFKSLFDDASDMIIVIDRKKRFANINKKFREESGCKYSKVGAHIKECNLLTKESRKKTNTIITNIFKNKPWEKFIEVEGIDKNGNKQIFELYAIPSKKNNNTIGVILILKNITEKKANELKLRENEETYKLINDNTSDFIIIVDLAWSPTFKYMSNSYHTVYGYDKNELVGTPALEIVHPDDHKIIYGVVKKFLKRGIKQILKKQVEYDHFQYRARSKDGKWHYVESVANLVGKQVVVVTRDICDRVLSEKMKTEFVSIASHQLRTPLTGIHWCASLLESEKYGELSSRQKGLVDKITKSNNRMSALVNDLLNVARIEKTRNKKITRRKIKVNGIIQEILEDHFALIEKNKISVINNIPDSCSIKADRSKIKHVFDNLINNAIKYSSPSDEVRLSCKEQSNKIIFKIKDTGIGVPKEQAESIFNKLFRADNAMNIDKEGTGLGLYIAKSFAELHNGKIWFKSQENKGSSFYFSIPK